MLFRIPAPRPPRDPINVGILLIWASLCYGAFQIFAHAASDPILDSELKKLAEDRAQQYLATARAFAGAAASSWVIAGPCDV